jgi:hypothetical protein
MANNFRINEDTVLNQGGAKTKARNNIAAIELLKSLELGTAPAVAEEQAILARSRLGRAGGSVKENP